MKKNKLHKRLESLPVQYRAAKVASFDYDKRTVTFSVSSETPVDRWYGVEILDHSDSSVDTRRIKGGIPSLFNHDRNLHLGRTESYEIKDKKLYVTVRMGNSALAIEKLNDVRDGILVDSSLGYIPHDYEFTEGKNGKPDTIRWTNWEPAEASLVTVPADPSVGVGRTAPTLKPGAETFPVRCLLARDSDGTEVDDDDCGCECEACADGNHDDCTTEDCDYDERSGKPVTTPTTVEKREAIMDEQEKTTLRTESAKAERERVSEIHAIQREHGDHFTREAADDAINNGATVNTVRKAVLDNQREAAKANPVRHAAPTSAHIEVAEERSPGKGTAGILVARTIRALAAGKGDMTRAARFAEETLKDPVLARSFAAAASSAVDGGYVLQGTVSGEIIELLRPVSVVRSLGPTIVPLDGTFTQNRLTGGAAGGYIGENKDIPASKGKFGQLKLSAKKLAAIIPVSNDLLRRNGGAAADEAVRQDLILSLANYEDVSFIRSQGSQYTPKGLRYWCPNGNLIQATDVSALDGGALVQAVKSDLGKLKLALRSANVRFIRPGIILSPRTEYFLQNLLNSQGFPVFEAEMATGKLMGYPYRCTTQIPENLTINAVTACTEIYFADFADVTIGDAPQIGIEFSTEASYLDPTTNTLVSAFSQDQTLMRVIMEHDLGMRHQESIAILNGVAWGK